MIKGLTTRVVQTAVLTVLLVALVAVPAAAAYMSDTGGPNGPCGPNANVRLALKYKGGAQVTYKNGNGVIRQAALPKHNTSYYHIFYTQQNELRWWRIDIVETPGYVSRQGSYGYCR